MIYIKNFDWRLDEKKKIHVTDRNFFPKQRQIWYAKLGVNVWHEADWKWEFTRPVLILKIIWSLLRCIPLTSQEKEWYFYYNLQSFVYNNKKSTAMLSQCRIIDRKRLEEMLWYVSEEELQSIQKALKSMYF